MIFRSDSYMHDLRKQLDARVPLEKLPHDVINVVFWHSWVIWDIQRWLTAAETLCDRLALPAPTAVLSANRAARGEVVWVMEAPAPSLDLRIEVRDRLNEVLRPLVAEFHLPAHGAPREFEGIAGRTPEGWRTVALADLVGALERLRISDSNRATNPSTLAHPE